MRINIYKNCGVWCYAMWVDGEYDHSDMIGIEDDATTEEARREMAEQFPDSEIRRVPDTAERAAR